MSEPLSDLEMTRLCAVAMGYYVDEWSRLAPSNSKSGVCICTARGMPWEDYDPLHNDAQCFELVERFRLCITREAKEHFTVEFWTPYDDCLDHNGNVVCADVIASSTEKDINRAIVTCCAMMWLSKNGGQHGNAEDTD